MLTRHPSCPLPGAPHVQRTACLCILQQQFKPFPIKPLAVLPHIDKDGYVSVYHLPCKLLPNQMANFSLPLLYSETTKVSPLSWSVLNRFDWNIEHLDHFSPLQSVKTGMDREYRQEKSGKQLAVLMEASCTQMHATCQFKAKLIHMSVCSLGLRQKY